MRVGCALAMLVGCGRIGFEEQYVRPVDAGPIGIATDGPPSECPELPPTEPIMVLSVSGGSVQSADVTCADGYYGFVLYALCDTVATLRVTGMPWARITAGCREVAATELAIAMRADDLILPRVSSAVGPCGTFRLEVGTSLCTGGRLEE